MIHSVGSDRESFKKLTFGPGLNVILADKSRGASDRQSRNGAGKTSFVELVHFLLGAEAKPAGIFRSDALRDWTFKATVDIGGKRCSISRSGRQPSRIDVAGCPGDWLPEAMDGPPLFRGEELSPPLEPRRALSNEQWKSALGAAWFGLRVGGGDERFHPGFRSLFSFAARRQEGGGFLSPMQHSTMQQLWDRQVTVCYLLGLDWSIPVRFRKCAIGRRSRRSSARRPDPASSDHTSATPPSCARGSRLPKIHDSHLFDGVDERQVAKALQLGAQRAAAGGFQYIVTLNSDSVPAEGFTEGFDVRDHVVEPRLTDATETGGLFGIRFN